MAINVANPAADLEDAELLTASDVQDIDGLKTFMRAPSAPFGVEAGSAMVTNFDADKVDGQEGAYYRDASNLNAGTISGDRLPDPLPALSGQNVNNLNADALVAGVVKVPTFTTLANTEVGAQNNWAPGLAGNTTVFWNGASDAVISGIAGGVLGQLFILHNITSAKVAYFIHQSGLSSAGNKCRNIATSGNTPVAAGGTVVFQYDGTDWRLIQHEQGAWITPAFDAAHFTGNGSMTWTVGAPDVTTMAFRVSGRTLSVTWNLGGTTVGGTPNSRLRIGNLQWGGFTIAKTANYIGLADDNGSGIVPNIIPLAAAGTVIELHKSTAGSGNWAAATDATGVYGQLTFEVD